MIDYPGDLQRSGLRQLWKLAFGDEDAFLDCFYSTGFSPLRCRCITRDGTAAAALYWFECRYDGIPAAYLYAIATHPEYRGQGLCRRLVEDTLQLLAQKGFQAALLVPQSPSLREMYRKMGFRDCSAIGEFFCAAGPVPTPLRPIGKEEYALQRKCLLPEGGVIQEGAGLDFLATYAQFYQGPDFLLAAASDQDNLFAMELLGNPQAAPGILRALGCTQGTFRTPGSDRPFAMFCPLTPDAPCPGYLGLAFD